MSLLTAGTVTFLPLPAGLDPRLPSILWFGEASASGNGSGGLHSLQFTLYGASVGEVPIFIDLRSIEIESAAGATAADAILNIDGFVLDPADLRGANYPRSWSVEMTAVGSGLVSRIASDAAARQLELGYQRAADATQITVSVPNDNAIANTCRLNGAIWLADAAQLPAGPQTSEVGVAGAQKPNYPVGDDSYYAKLRRGERPVTPNEQRQVQRIDRTLAGTRSGAPVGAAALASDRQIADQAIAEVLNRGSSINVALSNAVGLSPQQVAQQLVNASAGQTTRPLAPGRAYANLTGRFEEGNGGV